jgi:hypothetical protein
LNNERRLKWAFSVKKKKNVIVIVAAFMTHAIFVSTRGSAGVETKAASSMGSG